MDSEANAHSGQRRGSAKLALLKSRLDAHIALHYDCRR